MKVIVVLAAMFMLIQGVICECVTTKEHIVVPLWTQVKHMCMHSHNGNIWVKKMVRASNGWI